MGMEAADPILKIKIAPVFEILALAIVKKDNFYRRGPVKVIEIIRIPQNVLNWPVAARCKPFSPIQNNSDLAQGPLPIRPSKVRHDDIYLAPGGDTWHQNQNQLGSHMSSGRFSR